MQIEKSRITRIDSHSTKPPTSSKTTWALNAVGLFSVGLLLLQLVRFGLTAIEHATVFTGSPADGIFQLLSPLRRLAAGQTPGHDFQFFHGIGTLFLHYPLFAAAGGNLFAAELARWFLAPLVFVLSGALAFWAITKRWQIAALGAASLVILGHFWFRLLIDTGNSYVGVRSFLPVVIFATLLLWPPSESSKQRLIRNIALAIMLALTFFVSTEHGIAIVAAYTVASLLFGMEASAVGRIRHSGLVLALTLLSLLAMYLGASGRHFLEPIRYALQEVPADQFWYFGAPPSAMVGSIADLFRDPFVPIAYALAVALFVTCLVIYRRARSYPLFLALLALTYGVLSTVGILGSYGSGYVQALFRIELLVLFGLAFHLSIRFASRRRASFRRGAARVGFAVTLAFLVGGILRYGQTVVWQAPMAAGGLHGHQGDVLGTRLDQQWNQDNSLTMSVIGADKGTIWSLYAGLPEAEERVFQPSGYDYVIHALGPDRRHAYIEKFDNIQPKFVITLRPSYFTPWERWLENEHWDFFQRLANNYSLAATTSYSKIWKRTSQPWDTDDGGPWQTADLPAQTSTVDLGMLPRDVTVEVKIRYSVANKAGGLPYLGKLPRYLVIPSINDTPGLAVSLPPYLHEFSFPVFVQKDGHVKLSPEVAPNLFDSKLKIEAVQFRTLRGEGIQSLQASESVPPL